MIPWVFWKSVKIFRECVGHLNEELTMPPERADLVLPSHIPDSERNVLVFDGLDVETLLKARMFIFERLASTTDAPIVGIVVTISPSLSLYSIVVLPAASRPTFTIDSSAIVHGVLKGERYHKNAYKSELGSKTWSDMAKTAIEDARISFFPKRPERRRETERPIAKRSLAGSLKRRERRGAVRDFGDVG